MIRQPRKKNKPSTSECLLNTKANNHHQSQQHLTCPPFSLYADKTKASFEEGWASVVKLLEGRKNIAVLTGAGISVSCGIPDFRSKESGLYATLDAEALGLSCPEDIFDSYFFHEDPVPFYKFARQLYFPLGTEDDENGPRRVQPSESHKLLALLEQKKLLLRVYSQNIDGLEEEAGVSAKKVCYAHGSLQWATCCKCKRKVTAKEIEADILNGTVAYCQNPEANASSPSPSNTREPSARAAASRKRARSGADGICANIKNNNIGRNGEAVCGGVMKPGVTFFGEALHNNVKCKLESDREKVDALIVIGTSLSVAPISKVIDYLPKNIPRILINRTIVHPPENVNNDDDDGSECGIDFRESYVFDAYLLGYCDDVTRALRKRLFATSVGISLAQPLDEDTDVLGDLLSSFLRDAEYTSSAWSAVGVPPERVFLFPGSEAPTGVKEEIAFREIAHCDGCSKRIKGTIQKCIECFDFDLCHFCFPVLSTTHYEGQHHFIAETVAPF